MIQALGCVKRAMVSRGTGILDFVEEFKEVQPDIFIVNEDGNLNTKQELCRKYGVDYLVLQRTPRARVSSALVPPRCANWSPCRFASILPGGGSTNPMSPQHFPGPVVTISIEPTVEFNNRSGMASSTRARALDLWGPRLPQGDPEKLANILFCYDNPPGTHACLWISGCNRDRLSWVKHRILRRRLLAHAHRFSER